MAFFGDFMGVSALISTSSSTTSTTTTPGTLGMIVICAMGAEWKGLPFKFSRGCTFYRSEPDPHR